VGFFVCLIMFVSWYLFTLNVKPVLVLCKVAYLVFVSKFLLFCHINKCDILYHLILEGKFSWYYHGNKPGWLIGISIVYDIRAAYTFHLVPLCSGSKVDIIKQSPVNMEICHGTHFLCSEHVRNVHVLEKRSRNDNSPLGWSDCMSSLAISCKWSCS
jgi:hypothetical protein